MKSRLTAIVLAAGKGTRMRSDRPKVLYDLCGRPMLHCVLDALKTVAPDRILVVVSHAREQVEASASQVKGVQFVDQGDPRGTGHAVQVTEAHWGDAEQILILNGDSPLVRGETLQSMRECHRNHQIQGVSVLTAEVEEPFGYGRILRDAEGKMTGIREEADASMEEKNLHEVNSGVYLFDANQLRDALKSLKPDNKQKEIYLTDAVAEVRDKHAHRTERAEEILGANSIEDLALIRQIYQGHVLSGHMAAGVEIVDPATTYIDQDVEIGPGTTILPCTVIRSGVVVGRNCEIGPFTHLRVGTVLEDGAEVGNFTEVKKSTVGQGSKAKHLSYLGDTRIGAGVNIGAGTITANYDGKAKHLTEIKDGAFVGSGTVIVAPATVSENSVTGAGAVITRGTTTTRGSTYVGVPAKPLSKKGTQ